ncbi:hypothetical protein AYI68_g6855 [Smittium mucronatum]|uniref:Carbohydrate-binding module family 19 domain-containing protein n=1 Tax=Smittium mucronatum TaxID=133383 RepID=A0A1R0GQB2_9FUNG|nr:hypothetical protein AYI68_g6855 [Smittium mucronatum]
MQYSIMKKSFLALGLISAFSFASSQKCTLGSSVCAGDSSIAVCNGDFYSYEACPQGKVCVDSDGVPTCASAVVHKLDVRQATSTDDSGSSCGSDFNTQCEKDGRLRSCVNGVVVVADCPSGKSCFDQLVAGVAACLASDQTCPNNDYVRCMPDVPSVYQICQNNNWVYQGTCDNGRVCVADTDKKIQCLDRSVVQTSLAAFISSLSDSDSTATAAAVSGSASDSGSGSATASPASSSTSTSTTKTSDSITLRPLLYSQLALVVLLLVRAI